MLTVQHLFKYFTGSGHRLGIKTGDSAWQSIDGKECQVSHMAVYVMAIASSHDGRY